MVAVARRHGYRTFDVRDYGAKGDGTTDDTAAIQAALDAVPSSGGVVLFPPGTYSVPSGGLTCDSPVTIRGSGTAATNLNSPYWADGASTIVVTSGTATCLTLSARGSAVESIALRCSGTPAATGRGILVPAGGGDGNRYVDVAIRGFYINLDVADGTEWFANRCLIYDFGLYGIRVANATDGDGGDMSISDCLIYGGPTNINASAGLRYESGGGMRMTNNKFNHRGGAANYPDYCIDVAILDGVASGETEIVGGNLSAARVACLQIGLAGTTGTWSGINVSGVTFTPVTGRAILVNPPSTGKISDIAIAGNIMRVGSGGDKQISLSNVARVAISGNLYVGGTGCCLTVDSGVTNLFVAPADRAGIGTTAEQPSTSRSANGSWYYDTDLGLAQYAEPNITGTWIVPRGSRRSSLTYSTSITPDARGGDWRTITVTDGTAFTINAPTSPPDSSHTKELTVEVYNNSGGAMGTITWNSAYVLVGGSFTNPASGTKRFIRFEWNGSKWVETSRAGADYS